MKKALWLFLALTLVTIPAFAGTQKNPNIIAATTLDADPIAANSGAIDIRGAQKVAFFVSYDETEVGGISVAVTIQVSFDGTNWLAASFYDYAGGSTLQTSESLTADGRYYCWFNPDLTVPYVKLIVTATGSDADDTAIVQADMVTFQ